MLTGGWATYHYGRTPRRYALLWHISKPRKPPKPLETNTPITLQLLPWKMSLIFDPGGSNLRSNFTTQSSAKWPWIYLSRRLCQLQQSEFFRDVDILWIILETASLHKPWKLWKASNRGQPLHIWNRHAIFNLCMGNVSLFTRHRNWLGRSRVLRTVGA